MQKIVSSANHKHANLKTGLIKYLLSVLPINTDRYHYLGTFVVNFSLNSVFIVKKVKRDIHNVILWNIFTNKKVC